MDYHDPKVGDRFREKHYKRYDPYWKLSPIIEVRGIVDGLAVVRQWSYYKKRYLYRVEPHYFFDRERLDVE
jgi:hypothetical protein